MSLRVAKRLEKEGIRCRIIDIRWLQPLPITSLVSNIGDCKKILIVDECRQNSGIANELAATLWEEMDGIRIARVQAKNTYIPLGAAANLVLVQEPDIEQAARSLLERT
jgi:2-oxoisovalerate dehydrogenase E1 component